MKVISSVPACLLLLGLLAAGATASPMFGSGGMMKRRFPGSSNMSYNTYRNIAASNRRGDEAAASAAAAASPAVANTRFGGSQPAVDNSWMFSNDVSPPSSTSSGSSVTAVRAGPASLQGGVSQHSLQQGYVHQQRYPANFHPRDSYAPLQFPYRVYQDYPDYVDYPTSMDYVYKKPSLKQIYMPY